MDVGKIPQLKLLCSQRIIYKFANRLYSDLRRPVGGYRTPEEASPEKVESKARAEVASPGMVRLEADRSVTAAHLEESSRLLNQIAGLEQQIEAANAQASHRDTELKSERAKVQRITVSTPPPLLNKQACYECLG
jgi:hypothetical protein